MIDRVLDNLPPELRVMAEGMHMTLPDEQKELLNTDLCALFDALQAGDEETATAILDKWDAPPQCAAMLAMALGVRANAKLYDQE